MPNRCVMRFINSPCLLVLCSLLFLTGCISENPVPLGSPTTVASTTQSYVQVVTPYMTPTESRSSTTFTQATQPPEDIVCMIDRREVVFTDPSKTAISFNLVNPPMYINYTIPDTKKGSDGKYASNYLIAVRDKNTGTIYSKAAFGKDSKQGGYADLQFGGSDVVKVMKTGDLQIETEGKDITIISELWVKPIGNLDSSFDIKNSKCINWPQTYTEGFLHSPLGFNFRVDKTI
jgi:hypothetical protein